MIRFDRVSKRYGSRELIAHLSFEVADGEMVCITGRSGSGKSTLIRLIALLERASSGQIWVDGENLTALRARDIAAFRRRLGLLLQEPRLLMQRSVADNVALPLLIADLAARQRQRRVRALLEQLGLLSLESAPVRSLSAAERTRVALARALAAQPRLLLADEPTASLDAALSATMMELLRRVNAQGTTVLLVTHDVLLPRNAGVREISLERADATASELSTLPVIAAVR